MTNKKGNSCWAWFWAILFFLVMISMISNFNYQKRVSEYHYTEDMQEKSYSEQQFGKSYDDVIMLGEGIEEENKENMGLENHEDVLGESIAEEIVSSIIDGDTFKLSTGETVRLIGLNAAESGESCSSEATKKLEELILGEEVILKKDVEDEDRYGRLLRYVYINDMFVNLEMVRLGFAHKYEYGSNIKHSSKFERAESEAKEDGGCLWFSEEIEYIQDDCFYIESFHFNAVGDDNYNLNDEYVILGNKCSYSIKMDDWTIKDETASHLYVITSFIIESGKTFILYTGLGEDTDSALYWDRSSGDYAAIWNNDGDTLFLRDLSGNLVLSESYSGY